MLYQNSTGQKTNKDIIYSNNNYCGDQLGLSKYNGRGHKSIKFPEIVNVMIANKAYL